MQNHISAPTQASSAAACHPRPHLLVVEDDADLRDMLGGYLRQQGLDVTLLPHAETLVDEAHALRPDLVIMDIGLPGLNGLDACSRLRRAGHCMPLILLTARSDEVDRVLGLEMGADDYLVKPFSARELLARVRAALRRANGSLTPNAQAADTEVHIGEHVFDVAARSLRKGGHSRVLNTVEYALLAELVQAPHTTITRARLLSASHKGSSAAMPRSVDAAIVRLRKLLEPDPANPRHIQTVRGQGYVFVP